MNKKILYQLNRKYLVEETKINLTKTNETNNMTNEINVIKLT